MKRLLLLFIIPTLLSAQTARYPAALASDQDLGVARDVASSTLSAGINNSTLTWPVANGSAFAEKQVVLAGSEQSMICTVAGNVLTMCTGTRGFNGTTAASHLTGAAVRGVVSSYYVNALREEVQAIESALGVNLENVTASLNPGTLTEISKPAAPDANKLKVYAKDISGVTYFCAQNSDGEEICFAPAGIQSDSTVPTLFTFRDQSTDPAAPGSGKTALYAVAGVPRVRAGAAGAAADIMTSATTAGNFAISIKRDVHGFAVGDPAGAALATGVLGYLVVPNACTIVGWDIVVDAGTATVDIWKIATGTAKPTVTNTITASAKPAIATGTAIHSTTITAWTTAVSAFDIVGFNLDSVSTAKFIYVDFYCDRT